MTYLPCECCALATPKPVHVNESPRCLASLSALQRILIFLPSSCATQGDVPCGRIGAAPLGECVFHCARVRQHPDHRVIPLMTPGLDIEPIRLLVLLAHFVLDGPRFRPR